MKIVLSDESKNLSYKIDQDCNYYFYISAKKDCEIKLHFDVAKKLRVEIFNFAHSTANCKIDFSANIVSKDAKLEVISNALVGNVATRRANFEINFDKNAKNSSSSQSDRCFLLNDSAENISIPRVSTNCEQINAKHAFYSGYFDPHELVFLQSRGISLHDAKKILMQKNLPSIFAKEFEKDYKSYREFELQQEKIKQIREDFPEISDGEIYFDSAATSLKPRTVIKRVSDFYTKEYATTRRGLYKRAVNADKLMLDARKNIANFIGADTSEIIFNYNATNCLNLLANSLPKNFFGREDKIGICYLEHHSNSLPWRNLNQDYYYFDDKIKKDTKIVAVSAYSNVLGENKKLQKIITAAHKNGAIVVVDATQAVAHQKIDFHALDADFLVFSGHKIYGPSGISVLCGKYQLLEKLQPGLWGGEMVEAVHEKDYSLAEIPDRFEAGTQNLAGILGLSEAIKYLRDHNFEHFQTYEKQLSTYIFDELSKIDKVKIFSQRGSTVISFNIHNIHPHDAAEFLAQSNIAVRAGFLCAQPLLEHLNAGSVVRASISFYNNFYEAKIFIKKIRELCHE